QLLPRDVSALEAVCLKAMALRPGDRYATALELAADVEHWLADEPVAAYPESLPQRLRRSVRKHRTKVIAAASLAALLVTAAVANALVKAAREREDQARDRASEREGFATEMAGLRDVALHEKEEAVVQRRRADQFRYFAQMNLAHTEWEKGQV